MEEGLKTILKIIGAFLAIAAGIYIITTYVYPLMADVLNLAGVEDICEKTGLTVREYQTIISEAEVQGQLGKIKSLCDDFIKCFPDNIDEIKEKVFYASEAQELKLKDNERAVSTYTSFRYCFGDVDFKYKKELISVLQKPITDAIASGDMIQSLSKYVNFKEAFPNEKISEEQKIKEIYLKILSDKNTKPHNLIRLYEDFKVCFPNEPLDFGTSMNIINGYISSAKEYPTNPAVQRNKEQIKNICTDFIAKNPNSQNLPDIYFMKANAWGDYLITGIYSYTTKDEAQQAVNVFSELLSRFPKSSLAPKAALLAAKISQNTIGNNKQALDYYNKILDDYSQSQEAKSAKEGIESLSEQF